jgi:phytanoyl-CoA hydroxylase
VHATPPHQDNRYFHLTPPDAVMIFVALEPMDEENGALRYLPGSHKQGVRPHSLSGVLGFSQGITDLDPVAAEADATTVVLGPGDASCHHPDVVHWAAPNRSAVRSRPAFAMVFEGQHCRMDTEAFERYQRDAQRWDTLK